MLNLKATDYGLEPGTIGFEEAIELSYLDGEKEGKIYYKKRANLNEAHFGLLRNARNFQKL